MPISRRTILKALGIAPAIVAGAATVEAKEEPEAYTQVHDISQSYDGRTGTYIVEPGHVQAGWFVQTDLYDAGMANWDKVFTYYDRDGALRTYRITPTGVYIPQP
jgi:hypothetical protein